MQFKNVGDGAIVIPVSKTTKKREPEPPSREYGPLEIQDREHRDMVAQALRLLWKAMDLSGGHGGIQLPEHPYPVTSEAYHKLYAYIGSMLLGEDYPEQETLT